MNEPLVSVVITAKNEEKNIGNCLESIRKQSYPNIEVVVVDNNSTDRTKDISRNFTSKVYNIGPERSAQRNYGAEKSDGKYFLYLDADMMLSERVIEECVRTCEIHNFVALYIPEIIVGDSFWIKVRRFERSFYNATAIDCARFIDRERFLELHGFDLSLTGPEDWDMDRRLRSIGNVSSIRSELFHNEGAFDMKFYLTKKSYYSNSLDKYIHKWGTDDPEVRKQLGIYYRMIGVFFEDGKWLRLLRNPILAIGIYWLRFRVGLKFLTRRRNASEETGLSSNPY